MSRYQCENCRKIFSEEEREANIEIDRLTERVGVGEPMPAGQCPRCGSLVHPLTYPTCAAFDLADKLSGYATKEDSAARVGHAVAYRRAAELVKELALELADDEGKEGGA